MNSDRQVPHNKASLASRSQDWEILLKAVNRGLTVPPLGDLGHVKECEVKNQDQIRWPLLKNNACQDGMVLICIITLAKN